MSGALQRITSEYVKREDQSRLRGASPAGEAVMPWLTRQPLDRMVPHLIDWLGQQPQTVWPPDPETVGATPPVALSAQARVWLVDPIDPTLTPSSLTPSSVISAVARCKPELNPLACASGSKYSRANTASPNGRKRCGSSL